ncbi:hypothetical protein DXT77_03210 [Pseudomonas sp. 91RF]|jgi:hypothetical protein|uniref:hypothetical protein n=1 Tax=Pseudomonas sp. 91RF TaxID=2292261 RepID=UPI000E662EB1|nr:hypothetical protein [Pseudomonas sp. 91RF]RIJ12884.1 hypothetical protein DXT77_03210 [Pseudomonas sp. 91RF]
MNNPQQRQGVSTASFNDFVIDGFDSQAMTIKLSAVPNMGAQVAAKLPTNELTVDILVNPESLRMVRKSQSTQALDTIIPHSYLSDAVNKSMDCILTAMGTGTVFGLIKVIA